MPFKKTDSLIAAIRLVEPGVAYGGSYLSLVREFREAGEEPIPFVLEYDASDIPALIGRYRDDARGVGLPGGFVPHSTFWLVREGRHVVGVSNLRHCLTPELERIGGHIGMGVRPSERGRGFGKLLLRESLARARGMGIRRVLMVCKESNAPSRATILANGGVFASEGQGPGGIVLQKFWIQI